MWRERALLSVVVILVVFQVQKICATNTKQQEHACPVSSSSCGKISNITYPFRLKSDPKSCGDTRYELACENNVTVLYLYSGKYKVQAINYNNFTIRVVDPGLQQSNCSSLPRYFLTQSNFTDTYIGPSTDPYQAGRNPYYNGDDLLFKQIIFLNCTHPITDDPDYVDTAPCIVNEKSKDHIYAVGGDLAAEKLRDGCHVKLVGLQSWSGLDRNGNSSYSLMHKALVYGFEISWLSLPCEDLCGLPRSYCSFKSSTLKIHCSQPYCQSFLGYETICGIWPQLLQYAKYTIHAIWIGLLELIKGRNERFEGFTEYKLGLTIGHYILPSFWAGKYFFGLTLFIALMIYKWKKRHLSMYENIENFIEQNNLMPIRYSYKEIKKMARGFKDKLGEGGYGCVFKGKLCSGPSVAIKMLGKSKGNGHDFISEVATIGRIHHHNVVELIGFCVEGSKRALLYEFMPNGSLDKFIFSKDGSIDLSYHKIYDISIGVARGIAYLHHGCEMQILHFDIKPHNILLDEKFTPKVSDFGLAKLYPLDNSIVTMTAARGTIGYMAPELFYKNIGGISHKADVYSFGMLLMEMAGRRRNLNPHAENSNQIYFPFWIYDQLEKEKDIEMEDVNEEEKQIAKKMIIVALWCIQLKPNDRPSMNKVVKMLEEDIENLEIPPKPSLYPHETMSSEDQYSH